MSWSEAQVSNSTLWLAGLPEGATIWVNVCHAAMSEDWPQGSFSLMAQAGTAQNPIKVAKPAQRCNIFQSSRRTTRGSHGKFNFVIPIEITLTQETQDGARLFPDVGGRAAFYLP